MKYVIIAFWAIILGQVVGYITSSLAAAAISFPNIPMLILSLVVAAAVILIDAIAVPKKDETKTK
jgi:hypothetical protein